MVTLTQKAKSGAAKPGKAKAEPIKKQPIQKKPTVLEDDIPIPKVTETQQEEADPSQLAYPATVSSLTQELRPATPSVPEIKEQLKVNYSDLGTRIDDRLKQHLKLVVLEIEARERRSADLGQEIMTRKRLLAALQAAAPTLDDRFLKCQIQARDSQIATLTHRLFEVSARTKPKPEDSKARDTLVEMLQTQVETLTATLAQQEAAISEMVVREKEEVVKLKEEKEQMAMLQDGLQEELESCKLQLQQKDRMLQDSKSDLTQLAKIISDMTAINKDLNEKIIAANKDMEALNAANFQYKTRVENVEQVENTVNALMGNKAMYEKQFEKMMLAANSLESDKEKLSAEVQSLRQLCEEAAKRLKTHAQTISALASWQNVEEAVKSALIQVKSGIEEEYLELERLAKAHTSIDSSRQAAESEKKLSELKILDKEKTLQIEALSRSISALETSKSTLSERISALESELSRRHSDFDQLLSHKDKDIQQLREQVDRLKQQAVTLVEQRNDWELAAAKAHTQLTVLMEKIEVAKHAQENSTARSRVADQQQKIMSALLTQANKAMAAKEKEAGQREAASKVLSQKLKIMETELWNKDTEVLARESRINELSAELQSLRADIEQVNAKARKMIAEQLAEAHRVIEVKEHEAEILKGMLRSVQTQVKQKDLDIVRYKRKMGELPNEPYSPKKVVEVPSNQRVTSTSYDELHDSVCTFCSQVDRLRKFYSLKFDKISAAESSGSITPQWLKDELKLAKLPSDSVSAVEVLRQSLEHRINALIAQVQSVNEKLGNVEEIAQEVVMGIAELKEQRWEGLAETLKTYSRRTVFER